MDEKSDGDSLNEVVNSENVNEEQIDEVNNTTNIENNSTLMEVDETENLQEKSDNIVQLPESDVVQPDIDKVPPSENIAGDEDVAAQPNLNESEMLENPAEVNMNDLNKTNDENDKESDAFDPMDTIDNLNSTTQIANDTTTTNTINETGTDLDTTVDKLNTTSTDLFESLKNVTSTTVDEDLNLDSTTTVTMAGDERPAEKEIEKEPEEIVDDIEEGKDADEEISLLPERELTEADKEQAILAAADSENIQSTNLQNDTTELNEDDGAAEDAANDDSVVQTVADEDEEATPSAPKDFEIKEAPAPFTMSACFFCDNQQLCEFMFLEEDTNKFICSMKCIEKLRADKPDQFTLNLKKISVFVILEVRKKCARCNKSKICNYRCKTNDGYDYICDDRCIDFFVGNGERYVVKKKRYLVDESTVKDVENTCIQCAESKICKYTFKQEEEDLFICHEDCLNLLMKEQPDKIRVKRRSVRVRELPLRTIPVSAAIPEEPVVLPISTESTKIVARSEQEAEAARQDRDNSFTRRCEHCMKILASDPNKLLNWETYDFCNEVCLSQYQNIIGSSCAFCNGIVSVTSLGKYCVRFGYEIKQFCRSSCLDEYKKGLKVCSYCQRDISSGQQGFLAPVGDKGQFKDFCTQICMKKYDEMCNPKKKSLLAMCSVCNNEKSVRVEVMIDGKDHKFCSNPCFSAFKFVNNIYPDQCQMCQKHFERRAAESFTIYQNAQHTMFCTKICMNIYIINNRKIVPCNWCKVKKYNFDMINKSKGGQSSMLCSLNCLTLCQVSLNAISMTTLKCDQCNTMTMPQYLLSMSDASIRNFCTYQCVMSFQSQFSKTPLVLEGEPPSTPIPTGLPKRVRKEAYINANNANVKPKQIAPKIVQTSTIPIITSVKSLAGTSAAGNLPPGPSRAIRKTKPRNTITAIPIHDLQVSLERINTDLKSIPTAAVTNHTLPPKKSLPTRRAATKQTYTPRPVTPSPPPPPPAVIEPYIEMRPPTPIVEVKTQVVVVPPVPKKVSNMTTMCKPVMHTKGVTCRPQSVSIGCQTDSSLERRIIIPIPVPIYIPQPMYMYSLPTPIPVPIPLPIPVPIFIPTTRNSAQGIMKEIKKIQDKMPADPFEAELLMMAEMVAGDKKRNDSDSGSDIEDAEEQYQPDPIEHGNAFGEDMLQMALKMATEYDEPAVDLESAMPSNTITPHAHPHIPGEEMVDDPAIQHHHMLLMEQHRQLAGRGRKRGSGSTTQNRNNRNSMQGVSPNKKPRRNDAIQQIIEPPQPEPPREPAEKADANMCLKFTFGVNAWKQWVMTKNSDLEKSSIRRKPFKSDLLQLTADELNYSLCLFVKEVRKPNGSEYAPDTIYYLVLGIQQYLYEHGRIDNIFTDPYYEKFTDCLDEVARKFSVLYNDSQYIVTRVEEEHLWECKQLGAHSPHVLLSTLMFFNTKHFNLTTVEEHMQLSFSHIMKHWKRNPNQAGAQKAAGSRNVLLRFYPPQSSLDSNSRKKKVYEQQENEENPLRCPVKLYEFYLSKCPESVKTRNDVFYLQPERSCVPDSPVWYSTQALSRDSLSKMLHRVKMVKEINIALLTS